jgi:hypothetical protein
MKRALTIIFLLAITCFNVLAYSESSNWFNSASITGNIVFDQKTGVVEAKLDLGDLEPATEFSAIGNGTLVIGQTNGLNLTRFLMTPHLYYPEPVIQREYWLSRFIDLTMNFTIDSNTFSMPIIVNSKLMAGNEGSTKLGWIDAIYETRDRSLEGANFVFYELWNVYHLDKGVHSIKFDIFGVTNLVTKTLPIQISFVLELSLL